VLDEPHGAFGSSGVWIFQSGRMTDYHDTPTSADQLAPSPKTPARLFCIEFVRRVLRQAFVVRDWCPAK